MQIEFSGRMPVFPEMSRGAGDDFLNRVHLSGKKWVILADIGGSPQLALDADGFLRHVVFEDKTLTPLGFCHRPVIVTYEQSNLGDIIPLLHVDAEHHEEDIFDRDIILLWSERPKIITGSDILGRLLRGIVRKL